MTNLFRLILTAFLLISMSPLEAFCHEDHAEEETHQDCSLVCHSTFNATTAAVEIAVMPSFMVAGVVSSEILSYQNPILTRLKRPPIQVS